LRVVLAAQEPKKAVRVQAISRSLSKRSTVRILEPLLKVRSLGKVPSALLRYGVYALQEGLVSCDVLHIFSSPDFIHLLSLIRDAKLCYDYRSNYAEKLSLQYKALGSLAALVERKLASRADTLLSVNDILASRLRTLVGKRVYVVPNYPSRRFRARRGREEVLRELGVSGPIALFVGGLTYTYDFNLILEAASELKQVYFILIGSGPLWNHLKSKAPANTLLLGWRPHDQVADYIEAADVCLAPVRSYTTKPVSNDQDVWKVSEYASFSKPIIATGLAPSKQYLLVQGLRGFVQGIAEALRGRVPRPEPRFWEDHSERVLFEAYGFR
jgi:hypothetical protein